MLANREFTAVKEQIMLLEDPDEGPSVIQYDIQCVLLFGDASVY